MAEVTNPPSRPLGRSVFVTGANGYLGSAVCRAFVRAGWRTYGLVRRPESASALAIEEIVPIVGSIAHNATFLEDLYKHTKTIDVIVSCTEQIPFGTHYQALIGLLRKLAETSNRNGVRPLVLISSGVKDYAVTGVHGSPGLAPLTEDSPLDGMDLVQERATSCLDIFNHTDLFDGVVLRPTPLFGYGGSYYGVTLELAAAAAGSPERILRIPADFNVILHGCHVDDCAEAYLSLAEHPARDAVSGQSFNVSGYRYETLGDLAEAITSEYDLQGVVPISKDEDAVPGSEILFGVSQWVDSTKIRQLTGWSDKRMLMTENLHAYRVAYEDAAKRGDEGVQRIKERVELIFAPVRK
ncbi:NAD(P)-binding protein [Durotheca rogersii]|uniref:NAD(P)-binding protein n=1 Tax=Durotheca rogersii TaxID=419775 RepID=UPI002220E0EA|nr:NAD(P)-binding protein [Durotheca rogersii]KAI5855119.1 NAD(P)-binding protein [Durotheca rogersii]